MFAKDGSIFPATPEGIFKKKDLNSFNGPNGLDTSFEHYVTKIENECWPAISRTIEKSIVDPSDIVQITGYLALSRVRNPTVQLGIIERKRLFLDSTARLMDAHGDFDELGPNPVSPHETVTELLDSGALMFEVDNSEFLRAVVQMIQPFAEVLYRGFSWSLVFSPRGRVLISDHPLVFLHPGEDFGLYGIPPGGETCEVSFPLSKSIYLLGLWGEQIPNVESEDIVDELNRRQSLFANRHIAGPTSRKAIRNLAMRYSGFGYQTVASRVGPLGSEYHVINAGVYRLPNSRPFHGLHPLAKTTSVRKWLKRS